MTEASIMPVFVLGLQRSGTTWMANALGGHPDIAAVEAADHQGVHESIFFSHFARAFGDLRDNSNRERFMDAFTSSDYFLLTGLEAAWFRAREADTYPALFRALMEEYARRRGATYWLEKSPHHTLLSGELARNMPDARFIAMVRRPEALIRSRLWMDGREPPGWPRRAATLFRACAAVSLYQRHLREFAAGGGRVLLVAHEEMKADPEKMLRRVMDFLGLPFHAALLENRYPPNSSFDGGRNRDMSWNRRDRFLVGAFMMCWNLVPRSILRRLESRRHNIEWPDWCWKRAGQRDASSTCI